MQITVNGQHIAIVDDTLVSNSVNIYECEFEFDASWDGFAKTSVWQLNSDDPIEVVIDSGVAVIPHEVLENAGILRIGVYGTKDEKVMPTVWLEKRKVCLGTPTGSIGTEPTPSIYAQILAVATEAKEIAEDIQTEWESVTAEAETLPSGSDATVSFSDGAFDFGIPQGERGGDGEDGFSPIVAVTPITNGHRVTITDAEGVHTFDVLDGTDGADGVGITNIVMNADYTLTITLSNGTSFTTPSIRGEQGETGNGISSITKTATVGKVDTYTITYTDGTTTTFDVTNGEVTEASLEEALIDKADIILNSASGSIASFDDGAEMPVKSLEVEINAVQSGSGDPSPTNIRPISGWDSVHVVRTGFNLWDTSTDNVSRAILNDGTLGVNSAFNVSDYIKVLPSATYYFKDIAPSANANGFAEYDADKNFIRVQTISGASGTNVSGTKVMSDNTYYIRVARFKTSTEVCVNLLSSRNGEYEPYNGTTYPISLGQTVYGGVLDVTSGVLTINKTIVDLGTLLWGYSGESQNHRFSATMPSDYLIPTSASNRADVKCSNYASNPNVVATTTALGISGYQGTATIFVRDLAYSDSTSFTSAMSGVQLVYNLANPTTVQLTPTEVTTLLGDNNIWADCGEVAVIYRADTKAYIDGTIVDVPLAMIAPIENGTTSSKAYAVGEYFILNGTQFCKAKTAIASGATFTLNTNYTVTTIGAELKALA